MNFLPATEEIKACVRRVVEYATASANHYDVRVIGQKPPQNNPMHIAQVHHYRCVFSISIDPEDKAWRHLSISVPVKGQFATPVVALTIAKMFGFTGWDGRAPKPPRDWTGTIDKDANAVLLFQEFKT